MVAMSQPIKGEVARGGGGGGGASAGRGTEVRCIHSLTILRITIRNFYRIGYWRRRRLSRPFGGDSSQSTGGNSVRWFIAASHSLYYLSCPPSSSSSSSSSTFSSEITGRIFLDLDGVEAFDDGQRLWNETVFNLGYGIPQRSFKPWSILQSLSSSQNSYNIRRIRKSRSPAMSPGRSRRKDQLKDYDIVDLGGCWGSLRRIFQQGCQGVYESIPAMNPEGSLSVSKQK